MNATRTVSYTTKNGQTIEIKIERDYYMQDKVNYSDGWNIVTGRELVDLTSIKVVADGKEITRSSYAPHTLNPRLVDEKKMIAAGAYARIDNAYINEERYNLIMAAIAEMTAELITPEIEQHKADKAAAKQAAEKFEAEEAARYAKKIKNGFCPRCGSYCYGDCRS